MQRRDLIKTASLLLPFLLPGLAWAQDYPKPGATLRYVVPFRPRGTGPVQRRAGGGAVPAGWVDGRDGAPGGAATG